jgi:hypothetical protein
MWDWILGVEKSKNGPGWDGSLCQPATCLLFQYALQNGISDDTHVSIPTSNKNLSLYIIQSNVILIIIRSFLSSFPIKKRQSESIGYSRQRGWTYSFLCTHKFDNFTALSSQNLHYSMLHLHSRFMYFIL